MRREHRCLFAQFALKINSEPLEGFETLIKRELKIFSIEVCITSCCDVQSGQLLNLCIVQDQLLLLHVKRSV